MRCIALGVMVAALFASSAYGTEKKCELLKIGELPVTMSDTQPIISGTINGKPVRFLVDSGAFFSVLSRESAQKLQLRETSLPPGLMISGVGGSEKRPGHVKVKEFSLVGLSGGHIYNDIDFLITGSLSFGAVDGVIGQNMLGTSDVDIEYDLANGFVRLFHTKDCGDRSLAYWHGTAAVAEMQVNRTTPASPHWISEAKINDKKIRVMFDTGASHSMLGRKAATKAGIKPESDDVSAAGLAAGIGGTLEIFFARFNVLDLGGEQIKNARLFIGELSRLGGTDLLLGADFFLSHRIYFSPTQHRLYFTYNGGPVFDLRPDQDTRYTSAATPETTASSNTAPSTNSEDNANMSADDLRRRGTAYMGRNDFRSAIADFDKAIKLDPNDTESYYERGTAYWRDGRPQLASSDYDQALKIEPENIPALMARGSLRLAEKDAIAARADFDMVLRLDPENSSNPLTIANIFAHYEYHAESIERLSAWMMAYPKDPALSSALNSRCWSRAIVGQELDLALKDCNLALKKGSRNSAYIDSRAFVYLRRGEYGKSIADYQAVLKLQPKQAMSMYGLGLAELKKGLKTEGEQHMQTAVAISANVAEFYKKLDLVP